MKTSIIIPNYNEAGYLAECIASIRSNTTGDYEMIVVDNGSHDETLSYCLTQDITLISLPENLGFPVACNMGIKIASGDAVLLLNNDVLVGPHWLDRLLECLYDDPQTGVTGPMSNFVSGRQMISFPYTTVEETARKLKRKNRRRWLQTERIVGLCMLIKREVINEIGLLDEQFSPGHYEDDDFCFRARKAGYNLMIAQDAFVFHYGSKSFNKQNEQQVHELIARNRQRFIEKWGVDPQIFI